MGLGAVLVAAFALAPAAHASIAGAPSVATTGLDLRTVTIIRYDRTSGVPSEAEWCFSQPLTGTIGLVGGTGSAHTYGSMGAPGVTPATHPGDAPGADSRLLSLSGYASMQNISPDTVFVDPTNINCVVGLFGTFTGFPTQVRAFTVGSAHVNAVQASSGLNNHTDSVPLAPSDATGPLGRTTGPNILGVQTDQANNQIVYTLDHDLASTNPLPNATLFFYVDTSGVEHDGTAGGTHISNNVVRVDFAGLAQNAQIAVIGMKKGAIAAADGAFDGTTAATTAGEPNQIQTVFGPGTAAATNANPILTGARVITVGGLPTNTVEFLFDKQLNSASANCALFHIYSVNNRTDVTGTNPSAGNNINSVRCTFPHAPVDTSAFINQFVRAGVDAAAVLGLSPAAGNVVSTANLNPSASAPGFTSGPDITQATRGVNGPPSNSADVLVTYDQPVSTIGVPGEYRLIGPSANDLGAASAVSPVGINQVLVHFSNTGSVSASIGIVLAPCGGTGGIGCSATLAGFPIPPQVIEPPASGVFGFDQNDPAVEQAVGYVAGGAGQRLSIAKARPVVLKRATTHKKQAKKHVVKKHVKKHAKKH